MSLNFSLAIWLLLACVLIQLYYAAYYFWPFATRAPEPAGAGAAPVSVLVCAHNELPNLRRLLPLLLSQQYAPGFEVLLINDRSDDGTTQLAQELARHHSNFRLLTVRHTPAGLSPKKHALTQGIQAAHYPQLLFTDADCVPRTGHWIAHMAAGFGQPAGLVLGYSGYAAEAGFLNKLIRFETLLTGAQYLSFAWRGTPYMGVGRNMAYTRKVFAAAEGFASHIHRLSGDDDLLVQDAVARGARVAVVADPGAHTISEPARSWSAWWRQKRRHLSAGQHYRLPNRLRLGNFIGSNLLFYGVSLVLLISRTDWVPLAALWMVRTAVVCATYQRLSRRLHEPLPLPLLPLLDVVYFFYYLALGMSLFLYRNLRWK